MHSRCCSQRSHRSLDPKPGAGAQNRVGGGKAKMRWYFGSEGWPTSTVVKGVPSTDAEQTALIDVMQEWKSAHYQELVGALRA